MADPAGQWLTVAEAAALLHVSERTIRRRCESGKLPARLEHTEAGKLWRVDPAGITPADTPADGVRTEYEADLTARAVNPRTPADGVQPLPDAAENTRLARLEGYAAATVELAVSRAVTAALAPLAAEIAELRRELAALREDAPQDAPQRAEPPRMAPVPTGGNTGAQRGTGRRRWRIPWRWPWE
jgi:excisionase family DNA binding protein